MITSVEPTPHWQELSRTTILASAAMVVADLDQTLAFTKHIHARMISMFMTSLNAGLEETAITDRYSQLRGKAYSDILESMRDLYNTHATDQKNAQKFSADFFDFVRHCPAPEDNMRASEVPGARTLLEEVRARHIPLVVCTGSPRVLAERFIKESQLGDLVEPHQMHCWGDSQYSKANPEFWQPILSNIDRSRVIALDDHPHSVDYVLGSGGLGGAIIVPSIPRENFREVELKFPGKLRFVDASWDNWQ